MQAEKTYKDLVKARDVAITTARQKTEALKSGINDLKMKRALADFAAKEGIALDVPASADTQAPASLAKDNGTAGWHGEGTRMFGRAKS